jgi:ribosome-associated translation inhibitor RaiA
MTVKCKITHAQIAEQWVSPAAPPEPLASEPAEDAEPFPLDITTRGDVRAKTKASAREKVLEAASTLREPVLFARVKLTHHSDPTRQRPAVAEAVLDVHGDLVRAHVAAQTLPEAIDMMVTRLRDQLDHRARRLEHRQRRGATHEPGEWRHGDAPTARPPYFERPGEEREVLRQKTFAVDEITADEAVFDMEQLDYDFYLFRDLTDGVDSLIERLDDGTYRLTRVSPPQGDTEPTEPTAAPIVASETPAPPLDLDEAVERLNTGDERRLFFADTSNGHGEVLYRRYDGHYGLVTAD